MIALKWSHQARRDIERLRNFLSNAADVVFPRIANAIVASAKLLAENPGLGPQFGSGDHRKWRLRSLPYVIVYRVSPTEVRILRIRHMAEDWKPGA